MADGDEEKEQIKIDYDELDPTGFKKVEYAIWQAFQVNMRKPEDERQDADAFVDEYSENNKVDKARAKYVCTLGIHAGGRDEFNQRSGKGKALYPTGDTYDGEFYEGKKNGRGVYVFTSMGMSEIDKAVEAQKVLLKYNPSDNASSEITTEEFVAKVSSFLKVGKIIVEGILEYGSLPCYHGEYLHGLRNGDGVMKNKDGSIYKGQWKNNKRHGQGIYYYVSGDVYSGMWSDGLRDGFGTYSFDGQQGEYKGEWSKGQFVEGQWRMCDEITFEGKFEKNYPSDERGIMHFPKSGLAMKGVYKKGKWAPVIHYSPSELTKDELPNF
jgi:hypothetical protein